MLVLGALFSGLCIGCGLEDQPTAVPSTRIAAQVTVTPAAGDGCARLHVKVGPGSTATLTTIDNTSSCRSDELEVRVDSALVFNATTGVLRLPIVIRNLGTIPMGAPARLTFIADSAQLFDNDGNLIPGKPDIVVHNADSANASGRIGAWRYDTYLAPNGQQQVLGTGATSQRRWLELRATDWKNSVKISLSASAVEPSSNVVPALPPQNIPKALMDSLGSIALPDGQLVIPNLLGVSFVLGATQAQRQAAIDAVAGVVVGGWRSQFDETGTYYVLVPAQRSVALLLDAADALHALPQISIAQILYRNPRDEAAYLRPNDGAGFERSKWNVRYMEATDTNWAMERISAPLAWGCATGSSATRVAVIDQAYKQGSEVDANGTFFGVLPDAIVFNPGGRYHGLRVSSVLAAPADNDRGIAGVMWGASLDFRDWNADPANYQQRAVDAGVTDDLRTLEEHIVAAGRAGAKVINVSRSNPWSSAPDTSGATAQSQTDRSRVRNSANAISAALARLAVAGHQPLLVIAAGNSGIDARYSGFNHPVRRAFDSAQVLVVGGMLQDGQVDDSSNFGPLVSVYAPSRDVAVIRPLEVVTLDHGTSFAAPLVAGTAGLLLSFDSRLTAHDLKHLILAGAVDSVTEPNGTKKPILNAYGALKKAAGREGSGACANRVWLANDSIYVQRESTNEGVFFAPPPALGVTAGHGSVLASGSTYIAFRNGSWAATTETLNPYDQGSPERSTSGHSHDRDSLAYVEPSPNGGWSNGLFATVLHSDTAIIPTVQRTLTTVPMSQRTGPSDCVAQFASNNQCFQTFDFGVIRPSTNANTDNEIPVLSYSPLGDEILVALPHLSNSFGPGSNFTFTDCPSYGAGIQCRSYDVRRRVDSTVVWSVKRESGVKARLFSVPGKKVFSIMTASDGAEIATIAGPALTGELYRGSGIVFGTTYEQLGPCTTEFFRRDGTQPFSAPGAGCQFFGGTFAPKRRPWQVVDPLLGRSRPAPSLRAPSR